MSKEVSATPEWWVDSGGVPRAQTSSRICLINIFHKDGVGGDMKEGRSFGLGEIRLCGHPCDKLLLPSVEFVSVNEPSSGLNG